MFGFEGGVVWREGGREGVLFFEGVVSKQLLFGEVGGRVVWSCILGLEGTNERRMLLE